ncbi:Granulocyte-macrophage colony-stimulating factor receptor subunit alpha, partial [Lonchura striata]
MISWYMMLLHPLHADIQCMELDAQESRITNVNVDWRKMELSWESSRNFSEYKCIIMDRDMEYIETETCQQKHGGPQNTSQDFSVPPQLALLPNVQLPQRIPLFYHKVAHFIGPWRGLEPVAEEASMLSLNLGQSTERSRKLVEGEERKRLHNHEGPSKEMRLPFQCMNGSAIENFSCVIYNICFMNCTWQAGRDAPADTQYFLYWQKSRDEEERECELYIKDENCRNMGCIFQNVSIGIEKAYFLVNGSSKDSLIQFYDEYIDLYEI